MLAGFAVLLVLVGAFAGVLAGLLGVGGGIVIVPALFWVLGALGVPSDVVMPVAVASSLAIIVPTSVSSARAHWRRGTVDADLLRLWGPFVVAGALIGGLLSFVIDAAALQAVFGIVALAVAVNLAIPRQLVLAERLPASRAAQGGIAGGIGGLSALMGIGGGTLTVPILSAFAYPAHRAVGTAAAFGFLIAVPGVVGFVLSGLGVEGRPLLSLGYVSLPALLVIFPATVLLAPVGAGLAHRLPAQRLRQAFALFLGLTALRMLWATFG